jgi:hypothetical protein
MVVWCFLGGYIMISKNTIQELQKVIEEDYGQSVSFEHAAAIIRDAVKGFDLLARIDYMSRFWSRGDPIILRDLNDPI